MTRRIAIGGFLHESHSFAPRPTTYGDFMRPAGFPPLTEGAAMLDAVRGTSVPAAGALAVAEAEGAAIVPLAWCLANPAGPVQDEAFERIAARIDRGHPWARAFRTLDFWIPLGSQCTLMPPMQTVMQERDSLAQRLGAVELAFCFGFPYADFSGCGAAIAAFADSQARADAAADAFLATVAAQEASFAQETQPAAEAVASALRLAQRASRPVVLADTQDNPGGGGHGDTTGLLAELARQGAKGAVVCLINDADSVAACVRAGEGAAVRLSLGGKSDGMPFRCSARVEKLTDGVFTLTGPMGAGNPGNLGDTALIDIDGVRVIVASRKTQALDQAILRHVGIEPGDCPIIVLKSSVHFRADFQPIAEAVIVALAPGPVVADPATLNFRHVRAEIRRRPRVGQGAGGG
jgi:microcystin degradation protein MlrC